MMVPARVVSYGRRLGAFMPLHSGLKLPGRFVHELAGESNGKSRNSGHVVYPEQGSAYHNDLSSFLAYVDRTGLDPKSTVYVGTHYEYIVASTLSKYYFSLKRIGGTSDYGVDLLGTWSLPSTQESFRVLVQCKAGFQKIGPHLIRELEGAFVGAPAGWRGTNVLGFLASERTATKGIRESLGRSRWPMGFVCCSSDGHIRQILWNRKAEEIGLDGIGVGTRYPQGNDGESQLVLTWKGKPIPLLDS